VVWGILCSPWNELRYLRIAARFVLLSSGQSHRDFPHPLRCRRVLYPPVLQFVLQGFPVRYGQRACFITQCIDPCLPRGLLPPSAMAMSKVRQRRSS
jgi:hypothetical protein